MTPNEMASRRVDTTGWSTIALGAVCLGLAGLQAVVPILLRRLDATLDAPDDPMRAMRDAWAAGSGTGAVVNGLFGVALIIIGFGVTRRLRWAHPALEASCWASIAVLAILAKPSLAPFFALAGGNGPPAGRGMLVVAIGLVLAQIGAVLWFLRFWRKPEVRAAFR
jgi:hypothetical protein